MGGRFTEFVFGMAAGGALLAVVAVFAAAPTEGTDPASAPVMAASLEPRPVEQPAAQSEVFAALAEVLRPQSRPRQSRVTVRRYGQVARRSCRPGPRFVRVQ